MSTDHAKRHSIFLFFYHNIKVNEINICLDNWKHRLGVILGLSLLLVRVSLPGFSSGVSGFPSSTKKNKNKKKTSISKFQFDQDRGSAWRPADVASSLNILILIFSFFLHWKIVGFHVDENSWNASYFMVNVVLWSISFSMISERHRRNEQRFMSDQSTGWGVVRHPHVITGSQYDHFAPLMATSPSLRSLRSKRSHTKRTKLLYSSRHLFRICFR